MLSSVLSSGMDTAILKKTTTMERNLFVTLNDYQRLIGLIEFSSIKFREDEGADLLLRSLKNAKVVMQENISPRIVTMNSRVVLREIASGKEKEITIAYPHDANVKENKISVLSRAGAALLGRQEGDSVTWRVPGGVGSFEVAKVTFQPE